ncbi:MAG: YbbR-like domain-containing protein [Bacteroidaceae bacterium]|jgi:YbbR domain-containing protein|nr:YbbR-like domain-containing protein [Bacteroidaceae bacterium]
MLKAGRNFKQWKDKLFGKKSHELLIFCFFLAVSFGFWLLQALNETLEREMTVRLELDNVPSDVVIIDSLPSSIGVTLHDRGLILARQSISNLFRPKRVKVDFTKYDTGQNDAEVYISSADIQRLIRRNLVVSTKIQAIRPDTLRFSYNHGLSKSLPVKLAGTVKASRQYYIQSIRVEPESVKVFAPKAILDTMHVVFSDAFALEELQEPGSYKIALHKQKLVKYEPEQVNIIVKVGYYTDKTIQVPVIGLNFPAEKKLRTFPAQVNVTFSVESGRYNKVKPEDFVVATTYEELLQNTESSKLSLHLKTLPAGVSNVRISPAEVDYLIEQVSEEVDN